MQCGLTIRHPSNKSRAVINKTLDNLWSGGHAGQLQGSAPSVISAIWIRVLLIKEVLHGFQVMRDDCLAEQLGPTNIRHFCGLESVSRFKKRQFLGHTCPVGLGNWVETANFLTTGIIFDEGDVARNIDLAFLLCHLPFFVGHWLGARSAAISNDMFGFTEESRVAMKINCAILLLIPLGVKKQIFRVEKLLDLPCIESPTVRNGLLEF